MGSTLSALTGSSYPDSRVVETAYGKVLGRRLIYHGEKHVDAFQGIPFAKPPVGPLRFKKPQPPDPWEGILETKTFGKRSIQPGVYPFEHYQKGRPSEDCLYLNVFAPCWEAPLEGFPVMVFLHGGGFEMGDSITYGDIGICENLVKRDVIVVTTHYRLAYLGFFSTGDSACPGNLGLWDQTEALKWVQLNIGAFGGNKDNVTLFGQSAGGASVDYLHISPHSTGLFHKMMPLAGNAESRFSHSRNVVEQCKDKAKRLGVYGYENSEEMLEKLRCLPATDFGIDMSKHIKADDVDFETTPLIDGDFLPEPLDQLRTKAKPKPMMTGLAKEEGIGFIEKEGTEAKLMKTIEHVIPYEEKGNKEMETKLRELYCGCGDLPKDKMGFFRLMEKVMTDYFIAAGTLEMCRKTVNAQAEPVYLYLFDYFNPKSLKIMKFFLPYTGATHCAELPYLFHQGIFTSFHFNDEDIYVENIFSTAAVNFAKYGNPNGSDPNQSDLPTIWEPVKGPGYCNNYVINSETPYMSDQLFEGRTQKYIDIMHSTTSKCI